MSAAKVYAEQLFRLGHGYPLWDPEPTKHGEVLIGDVGFIFEGSFHRLFNATKKSHEDGANKEFGVPDGFKPFTMSDYGHEKKPGCLIPGPLCSKTVKHTSANAQLSV